MSKRVVYYLRVSSRDKGQDTDNQRLQMEAMIAKRVSDGWALAHTYEDHETGSKSDREHFQRMLKDASLGKFDVLVFWSLDRFTREGARETLNHLNALTDAGIEWCSVTEQYLDTCGVFREAVIAILAVIAKQERIRLSERVKAGMERAKLAGKPIGKPKSLPNLEQFAKAVSVYSNHELMELFNCSRTTVMNAKRAILAQQAQSAQHQDPVDPVDPVDPQR